MSDGEDAGADGRQMDAAERMKQRMADRMAAKMAARKKKAASAKAAPKKKKSAAAKAAPKEESPEAKESESLSPVQPQKSAPAKRKSAAKPKKAKAKPKKKKPLTAEQLLNRHILELREARSDLEKSQITSKANIVRPFKKGDKVMFLSKDDKQYVPGELEDRNKGGFWKVKKIVKFDEDDEEDPMRYVRTKSPLVKPEGYYKLMSVNDFEVELSITLLHILRTKLRTVVARQRKEKSRLAKIARVTSKIDTMRDVRHQQAQSVTNVYAKVGVAPANVVSPKGGKGGGFSQKKGKGKKTLPASGATMMSLSALSASAKKPAKTSKPKTPAQQWTIEDVQQWLMSVSGGKHHYFNLYSTLFIKWNIDGPALLELSMLTMANDILIKSQHRRLIMQEIDKLRPKKPKKQESAPASARLGASARKKERSKTAVGDLTRMRKQATQPSSKKRMSGTGTGTGSKKSTSATSSIRKSTTDPPSSAKRGKGARSSIGASSSARSGRSKSTWEPPDYDLPDESTSYAAGEERFNPLSKSSRFEKRKAKAPVQKRARVADIDVADNYQEPDYADDVIRELSESAPSYAERSRYGGGGDYNELGDIFRDISRSGIPLPPDLQEAPEGYHSRQTYYGSLRQHILKYESTDAGADNDKLRYRSALKNIRLKINRQLELEQNSKVRTGKTGDLDRTYGKLNYTASVRMAEKKKAKAESSKDKERSAKFQKRLSENKAGLKRASQHKKTLSQRNTLLTDDIEDDDSSSVEDDDEDDGASVPYSVQMMKGMK